MNTRILAVASMAGLFALVGCGANNHNASLLNSASLIEESDGFRAPYYQNMGEIAVSVSDVLVNAGLSVDIGDLGPAVRSQMIEALSSSANFVVVDRSALPDILDEQKLADAGLTDPRDRPIRGQLASPRYIIAAHVTELQENVVGKSGGGKLNIGSFIRVLDVVVDTGIAGRVIKAANPAIGSATETIEGVVGLSVRVIDVDTGAVVATANTNAKITKANSRRVVGVAGIEFAGSDFAQSVIGHATRIASQRAVVDLHGSIRSIALREQADDRLAQVVSAR